VQVLEIPVPIDTRDSIEVIDAKHFGRLRLKGHVVAAEVPVHQYHLVVPNLQGIKTRKDLLHLGLQCCVVNANGHVPPRALDGGRQRRLARRKLACLLRGDHAMQLAKNLAKALPCPLRYGWLV
jgi:hypothetical protein